MSHYQSEEQNAAAPNEAEGGLSTIHKQAQNITVVQQQVLQQYNQQYHTTIYNLPEQSFVPFGDQGSTKGYKKLQKATRKQYHPKHDVVLCNFDISREGIPEIYSEMYRVNFYQGMCVPNDDNYSVNREGIKLTASDRAITIDQLVSDIQEKSFVSVIGYPGSGKTTLSKRLARYLAKSEGVLVLRKLFMDMNDSNEQLTLKEFLLGDCNYNLNDEEKQSVFEWVTTNPENCFIILDGFDQVSWNLQEKVEKLKYSTLLHYSELLSNLCLGNFLRDCHLIFTSRPHAMLKIPRRFRPESIYFIHDLTSNNMKTLFDALVNDQQQSEIFWNDLTVKTPHLKPMLHNPLMLQLYLRASLGSSHEADISTMTRIFHAVLLNLKNSKHAISLSDDIVIRLSQIAYIATKEGTVLIKAEDLVNKNLSSQKVQDLVVTLLGANREYALLEGQQRLYFNHQTFQEYFTALYICREMSLPDFRLFVGNQLLENHWSVVVQFLSGLLLDPFINKDLLKPAINQLPSDKSTSTQSSSQSGYPSLQIASSSSSSTTNSSSLSLTSTTTQLSSDLSDATPPQSSFQLAPLSLSSEKLQKKEMFISELQRITRNVAASNSDRLSIIDISKILRESNNEKVIGATGSHFDGGRIQMYPYPFDTQNDFHAVTSLLKSMPARVRTLDLSGCKMTSNQFRPWVQAIKSMPGSIVRLNLEGNILSRIDDVIEVLNKIEELVVMWNCFDDGDGTSRSPNIEERARLQEALDELKNNKKLKVVIGWDGVDIYLTQKD